MALNVRKATPDDVPVLMPLIQSAYRGDASRRGWTTEADLVGGIRIDIANLLIKINEPAGGMLVAFPAAPPSSSSTSSSSAASSETATPLSSATPVPALACCEIVRDPENDRVAYFGLFAVDPERQGGGLGKEVLAKAEAWARDVLGVDTMEMTVIWTRNELLEWYQRRGYTLTGEKRPFPYNEAANGVPLRDDLHFVVMEKKL